MRSTESDLLGMGTRAAYLAMTLLALAPAAAARAQGLVITPLPSQQVIEALTPPLPDAGAPPVQPAQTDPGRGAPLRASLLRFIRSACHPIRMDSSAQLSAVSGNAVSHSNGTAGNGSDRSAFHASNVAISAGSAKTS